VFFFRAESLASAIRTATLNNPTVKSGKVFEGEPKRLQRTEFSLIISTGGDVNGQTDAARANDYDLVALNKGHVIKIKLVVKVAMLALLEDSEGVKAVAHGIARKKDLLMGHAVFLMVLNKASKSLDKVKVHLQRHRVVLVLFVDRVEEERKRTVQNPQFLALAKVSLSVFAAVSKC
jgi:hypothetical protein